MRSLFFILFAVSLFSCKENTDVKVEENSRVYVSQCSLSPDSTFREMKFILTDTSGIILPYHKDPHFWNMKDSLGNIRTSIRLKDLVIDFSNRDSVVGYLVRDMVFLDTVAIYDRETYVEEIKVIENMKTDTIKTCVFK